MVIEPERTGAGLCAPIKLLGPDFSPPILHWIVQLWYWSDVWLSGFRACFIQLPHSQLWPPVALLPPLSLILPVSNRLIKPWGTTEFSFWCLAVIPSLCGDKVYSGAFCHYKTSSVHRGECSLHSMRLFWYLLFTFPWFTSVTVLWSMKASKYQKRELNSVKIPDCFQMSILL